MYVPIDPERDLRVRAALAGAGLEALLAWRPEEIVLTTGSYPHLGMTFCLYPRVGDPILYVPAEEPDETAPLSIERVNYSIGRAPGLEAWAGLRSRLAAGLSRLVHGGRTGYSLDVPGAQHAPAGNAAETAPLSALLPAYLLDGHASVDAGDLVVQLLQRKTALEIEALRRTNRIALAGIGVFYDLLVPGRSEAEIAGLVEATIQAQTGREGSQYVRAWAGVQSGPNAPPAGLYSRSSGRTIEAGDVAVLELATCVDGYWSDLSRTAVAGEPSAEQAALLRAVRDAQDAGIAAIRAGVSCEAVDRAARGVLEARGDGTGFTHASGH